VAQAPNAIVRSVRPDNLGFRRHLEKVAAAASVVSGAVPLRSCEGPLVAQSGRWGVDVGFDQLSVVGLSSNLPMMDRNESSGVSMS
jgi:hypothetical protein